MLTTSESLHARDLPRGCTFSESDWRVLAAFWYPVAFSHEITGRPHAVTLLDERVVVYRLSDGSLFAARDICHHRGVPFPSVGPSTRMHPFRLRWTSTIRCLPKILPSLSDNPQRTYRLTFRLKLTFLPTGVRLLIEGALLKSA